MKARWFCIFPLFFTLNSVAQVGTVESYPDPGASSSNSMLPSKRRIEQRAGQSGFLDVPIATLGLKSQFFFIDKEVFKGIYYDEKGRQTLTWAKQNNKMLVEQSTLEFTQYEGDSLAITFLLNPEIKNDLTVNIVTDEWGYNGSYVALKTEGNREIAFRGAIKIISSKRKLAMEDVPNIDVEFFVMGSDTTTYHYVTSKNMVIPQLPENNVHVYTNQRKGTVYKDGFFEQKYNYSGFGYELSTNVSVEDGTTTLIHDKTFFNSDKTFYGSIQPAGNVITQEIFDEQNRVVRRLAAGMEERYRYIGPLTEIREKYSIDKKGREKLRERVEVMNTYY